MAKQRLTESQLERRNKLFAVFDVLGPLDNEEFVAAKIIAYDKRLLCTNEIGMEVKKKGVFGQEKRQHIRFCSPGDSLQIWCEMNAMGKRFEGWVKFDNTQDVIMEHGFVSHVYVEDNEKVLSTNQSCDEALKALHQAINDPNNKITKEMLAELIPNDATLSDWKAVRSEEMERRRDKSITLQDIMNMNRPELNDEQSLNELVR